MDRTTVIAVATVASLVSAPALAMHAAPGSSGAKAGVLPLSVEGKLPPNGPESLAGGVQQGLSAAGAAVLAPRELEQAAGKGVAACADPTCFHDAAAKAELTHLVRPSVTFKGSDYALAIDLVDGASGDVLYTASDTCELCGLTEAVEMMAALAGTLPERMSVAAGVAGLAVSSDPPGATVLVDGDAVGVTPLQLELEAGEHQVIVSLEGYFDRESLVRLEAGGSDSLGIVLDPTGPRKGDKGRSGTWGRIRPVLPWVSLGVGVAALGSGIALIAIDEKPVEFTRCSGNDVDHLGNCRFRHNTIVGGLMMTLLGVGGIAAGVTLLVLDKRKGRTVDDRRVRLRPTHDGLALHF